MKTQLLFNEESYKIIGACFELAAGVQSPCTPDKPAQESRTLSRGTPIPFVSQKPLTLEYKGCPLRSKYEPDFICYEKIILELKAVTELTDEHRAQVQNYLKATRTRLGLLINSGHYPKAQIERIVAEKGRYAHAK